LVGEEAISVGIQGCGEESTEFLCGGNIENLSCCGEHIEVSISISISISISPTFVLTQSEASVSQVVSLSLSLIF
jgi:hypothetical protein